MAGSLRWNPAPNGEACALGRRGAGGVRRSFTSIASSRCSCIAALNVATGLVAALDPNASSSVIALCTVSGDQVYAGGGFLTIGGQARNRIAALDAATGLATAWNPNANNYVYTLLRGLG